ncbi:MAG: membrane protein insertion efficiency factor YidD [Candidatus Riflebacteria bacterium]|nr:membrane protein insertion efficiency factor YidD [Candidatus Riflebacteria bacterium]
MATFISSVASFPASAGKKMIRFYQRFISPMLPPACIYEPSCSQYTYEAIAKYGLLKGSLKGAWRICRCNPFAKGGHDPLL